MQRDELIAQLGQARAGDLRVLAELDGRRFEVHAVQADRSADDLVIYADTGERLVVRKAYNPEADDDVLVELVTDLRSMWREHQASPRRGNAPDFYAWATTILRNMYDRAFLTVPLPAEVDPTGPCTCERTPTIHKPRQDPKCLYRREVRP